MVPVVVSDWKSKLTEKELEELPHMMEGREVRAKEIMTSEQSYVEFLNILTDLFVKPLSANPMGLTKADIKSVFCNVDDLAPFHVKLLKIVQARLKNWNENSVIGDVFLTNTSFMTDYMKYVNNYEDSLNALDECRKKSEEFAKYLSSLEETPKMRNLKLVSFLVAPVQRVMRYSMLLEEVLKKTPRGHPDQEPLRHAVAMLKNLAQYINEKKRNVENLAYFEDFKSRLKGLTFDITGDARRVLLKENDACQNTPSNKVHLFLFSDMLFITKAGKRHFTYKDMFILSQCTITADQSQAFTSVKVECASKEPCELIFDNPAEAKEWFKAAFTAGQSETDFAKLSRTSSSMRFALTEDSVFTQRANMERAKKQRLRLEALIESETKFGERITQTWNWFMEPLKVNGLLKPDKVSRITTSFNLIRSLQSPFLAAMKGRLAEWGRTNMFSDVLNANMSYIRGFILYLTHFKDIVDTLDEANGSAAFQHWIIRVEAEHKTLFDDEIAEPLHHFYDMFFLLQEFSLMSRKDNPDGEELKSAMAKVKGVKDDFVLHAAKFKSIKAVAAVLSKFTSQTAAVVPSSSPTPSSLTPPRR